MDSSVTRQGQVYSLLEFMGWTGVYGPARRYITITSYGPRNRWSVKNGGAVHMSRRAANVVGNRSPSSDPPSACFSPHVGLSVVARYSVGCVSYRGYHDLGVAI